MQDTKVEWGYLGKGATGVMTMWLGRACPMVIKHVHPGMRQIWVQIPSSKLSSRWRLEGLGSPRVVTPATASRHLTHGGLDPVPTREAGRSPE